MDIIVKLSEKSKNGYLIIEEKPKSESDSRFMMIVKRMMEN